jgi:hypothetical protein
VSAQANAAEHHCFDPIASLSEYVDISSQLGIIAVEPETSHLPLAIVLGQRYSSWCCELENRLILWIVLCIMKILESRLQVPVRIKSFQSLEAFKK